jgi:LysM repeat protein
MRLKKSFWCLMIGIGSMGFLQAQDPENPAVLAYIAQYREMAIAEMERTGVPAAIKLAQGIHETDAGRSDLVLRSNNHFGIKCKTSWTGEKVYHDDDMRGECFRKYPDAADSYRDHSDYLKSQPRYASLFTLDPMDYKSWAHGLKKAGYATNPKYTHILIKYIETYRLNEYSAFALGRMKEMPGLPGGSLTQAGEAKSDVKARPLKSEMEAVVNGSNGTASGKDRGSEPGSERGTTQVNDRVSGPPVNARQSLVYPSGEFLINDTRVMYAAAGSSLRAIAEQYHFRYSWMLDFNDLPADMDILNQDQLVFLQRKRKRGDQAFHEVGPGESMYHISQIRGIRLESLLSLNHLDKNMEPAIGTQLYLQEKAPVRPELAVAGKAAANRTGTVSEGNESGQDTREIRHLVQPKETLYSLARKYEVGVDQIKAWNKLESADLKPGQELLIIKRL